MTTIRWGIIGCGDVTEVKSGPAFQKANNSTLVAVMRRNGDLAKDYAKRHNVPKWYQDANQLITDPNVNAIYISTPPAYHKDYTLACAKAGKPIYVEKPMAMNYSECLEMISGCETAEVPLFVAYYRRALPRFVKLKQLVDKGVIGIPRIVSIKNYQKPMVSRDTKELPWRVIPEISGGGLFMDVGCHTLDIMDYLLGPIKAASGYTGNQGQLYAPEDTISASFSFECGVLGSGLWCFSAFESHDRNEIIGTEGKLRFSTFGNEPIILTTRSGITEISTKTPIHIQQPLVQAIVNELLGQSNSPSTGKTAARTNWVMEQIIEGI